ncbi:hypothetical protein Rs2_43159 [Raphanus sativus]|nr:hypothetical protein Rs2_43159 [Raphanus sativus]
MSYSTNSVSLPLITPPFPLATSLFRGVKRSEMPTEPSSASPVTGTTSSEKARARHNGILLENATTMISRLTVGFILITLQIFTSSLIGGHSTLGQLALNYMPVKFKFLEQERALEQHLSI